MHIKKLGGGRCEAEKCNSIHSFAFFFYSFQDFTQYTDINSCSKIVMIANNNFLEIKQLSKYMQLFSKLLVKLLVNNLYA